MVGTPFVAEEGLQGFTGISVAGFVWAMVATVRIDATTKAKKVRILVCSI